MNLGNVSEVESLINRGANVNFTYQIDYAGRRTPLHVAVNFVDDNLPGNGYDIFELLIKHGADIEGRDSNG